ncbi:pirin family protein [Paenibacillus thalictri]|uniref:Pirin family protein n=1 Tax=Paenibacillus thalictri TaxID=2527873 RepID=A0A4Q9DW93_9BACL|nr:pirin family protein [Paenibacillus thalictri]TBL80269.1 pirin family protein [Paenibacillus thalictri]
MIRMIRSNERGAANHDWLQSRFSFSFAEYYDPSNRNFGALRVFNDDTIQPGTGFGMHPHADMEIVTYVIEGTLEHKDSLGNTGLIEAGEVQRMTAGTGIFHSEYNHSQTEPVHLLQLWFLPKHKDLEPSWEQIRFTKEEQRNVLLPVISGTPQGKTLSIHQDITLYMSSLEQGKSVSHQQGDMRGMYVFVIKGALMLDGEHKLEEGDTARITQQKELSIRAESDSEFMLIDLS